MHHAVRWGTCRWVARCALRVCAQKHLAIAGCVQDHVSIHPPTSFPPFPMFTKLPRSLRFRPSS